MVAGVEEVGLGGEGLGRGVDGGGLIGGVEGWGVGRGGGSTSVIRRRPCHSLGWVLAVVVAEVGERTVHYCGGCADEEDAGVLASAFRRVDFDLLGVGEGFWHLLIMRVVSRWCFGLFGVNEEALHVCCLAQRQ